MRAEAAKLRRRLASLLYESLILLAVVIFGFLLPQMLLLRLGVAMTGKMQWLHIFLLLMLYFVWFWLHGGQTLPMKTWGLRLIDTGGGPPRPVQALLRYMAAWPSAVFFGLGFIWAALDPDRQFLHDRIAGTRIIRVDGKIDPN